MTQEFSCFGEEGIDIDVLDGDAQGVVAVLTATALGLTDADPVGGFVAGAFKAALFHEGFQEVERMSVFGLPIGRDAAGDASENMAGQMRDFDPWQDQVPVVIGDPGQALGAGRREPSDPLVARRDFPSRRAEEYAGQIATRSVLDTIGDIFTDGAKVSQVMVAGQEPGERIGLRIAPGQGSDGEREALAQGGIDFCAWSQEIEEFGGVESPTFGREPSTRGQHHPLALVELEHQGARRHVFELAAGAVPIPGLRQQS